MVNEALPSEEKLLPLHCVHGIGVYRRCGQCEDDAKAGRSNGFTPKTIQALEDLEHEEQP